MFVSCFHLDFLCLEDQCKFTGLLHDIEQKFQELPLLVFKTAYVIIIIHRSDAISQIEALFSEVPKANPLKMKDNRSFVNI
jgi:hypothetical protein